VTQEDRVRLAAGPVPECVSLRGFRYRTIWRS
jgi:hypothetical protein